MRKESFLFLVALLFACNVLNASTWAKSFDVIREDNAVDAVALNDGSFFVLVQSNTLESPCCDKDTSILHVDSDGNVIAKRRLLQSQIDYPFDIEILTNGNIVIAGYMYPADVGTPRTAWIVEMDQNLDIVWQKSIEPADEYSIYSVTSTSDGGMVVGGSTGLVGSGDAWLAKLDSAGGIQWQKSIGLSSFPETAVSVIESSNGEYITTGYIVSLNNFWIARVDINGNLLWAKTYTPPFISDSADIVQTFDGGFAVLGNISNGSPTNIFLMKVTTDGTPEWFKSLGEPLGDSSTHPYAFNSDVIANPDGTIVLSGTTESYGFGLGDFWIVKVNDQGTIQWQKSIGGISVDWLTFIIPTDDFGYLSGGSTSSFPYQPFSDAWLLKIDAAGNLDQSCQLSFDTFAEATDQSVTVADANFIVSNTAVTVADPLFVEGDTLLFTDSQCEPLCPLIDLAPPNAPAATVGTAYSLTVIASGGVAPYTYLNTLGSLPDGLTLDSQTGEISGIPQSEGTFGFVITATDANGCSGERVYAIDVTCPSIQISPATLPDGVVGQSYNQQLSGSGGSAPYTFSLTNGSLPDGLSLASDGLISGLPTTAETANFEVTVSDSFGCTSTASYTLTIQPIQSCLFCDDFNDGILATNWTYPKGIWAEAGGVLTSSPQRKATAIATPVYSGCTTCTVQASLRTAGGTGNRVWLLAWYQDSDNYTELLMKEESDKWVLKQHSSGVVVAKQKGLQMIQPNTDYDAEISFDGANFQVTIDGQLLMTMPKFAGTSPSGTVGFQIKATTGSFDFVSVF